MLFKRKKKTDDTQLHIESIPDESTKGFNVVEICEQMVDASYSVAKKIGQISKYILSWLRNKNPKAQSS